MAMCRRVFITGATGFVGSRLAVQLLHRGHRVRTLVRAGSERKVPPGCEVVAGDALDHASYAPMVVSCDAFVHLVGVSHPSPAKRDLFRTIDLTAAREAVIAARGAAIAHFVYVSVAHPAPVMRAYIAARAEAESLIRASGLNATVLRPWYVLGPGHRWPLVLLPLYWLAELVPLTRAGARRLGLVTVEQLVGALVVAIERPPQGVRILEVSDIRGR